MGLVAIVVLSGVLGTAAVLKFRGPLSFRVTLTQLVPAGLARILAGVIPVAEILVAAALVSGLWPRAAGIAALFVLGTFTLALIQMWRLGLNQDCGCFGESREAETPVSGILRNAGLLALSAAVLWDPRALWDASASEIVSATSVAVGVCCLWMLVSALVTRRDVLFLPRTQ